jgi:hypothetical protein
MQTKKLALNRYPLLHTPCVRTYCLVDQWFGRTICHKMAEESGSTSILWIKVIGMPTKVRNTLLPQHIHRRGDVYYFVQRPPSDVRELHVGHRFYFSLRTRSETAAIRAANSISQRLESYWMGLRLEKLSNPHSGSQKSSPVSHQKLHCYPKPHRFI